MELGVGIAAATIAVVGFLAPNIVSWAASYKISQVRKRHRKLREEGYSYAELVWQEEQYHYIENVEQYETGELLEIVRTNARARATHLLRAEDRPWAYAGIDEFIDYAVEHYLPRAQEQRQETPMIDILRGEDTLRHINRGLPEGAFVTEMCLRPMDRTYVFNVHDSYAAERDCNIYIREDELRGSALHREQIPAAIQRLTDAINLARRQEQQANPFAGMPATYDGERQSTYYFDEYGVKKKKSKKIPESWPAPEPDPDPPSPTRRMIRRGK